MVHRHSLNLVTAALLALAVWRLGLSPELPAVLAFIFGGVLLCVIDWKACAPSTHARSFTTRLRAWRLDSCSRRSQRDFTPLVTAVVGAVLFINAFFLIWMVTTKYVGMKVLGFGDVRLAAVLGLLFGWYGLPYVLYGAIVGHVLTGTIAVGTCLWRRQVFVRYAFGPPLIAGALAVVLIQA